MGFGGLEFSGNLQGETTVLDGEFALLDATHEGSLTVGGTGSLRLEGRIENEGTIRVQPIDPDDNFQFSSFLAFDDIVLVGDGELVVEVGVENAFGTRITNVNHTIRGAGFLGFEVVNRGTLFADTENCLLYTSPSPRDKRQSRMPSSA